MRLLVTANLLLTLAAIAAIMLIREHQVLVQYSTDEMLHWAPVRPTSSPILLPLEYDLAGSYYYCLLHFVEAVDEREQNISSSLDIHGEDLEGNRFEIVSADAEFDDGGRTARISIPVLSNDITYLAVTLHADLRSKVDIVGVSASTPDVKASSVNASITRDATRNTLIMLVLILLIQIALLIGLTRQRQRPAKTPGASASASDF